MRARKVLAVILAFDMVFTLGREAGVVRAEEQSEAQTSEVVELQAERSEDSIVVKLVAKVQMTLSGMSGTVLYDKDSFGLSIAIPSVEGLGKTFKDDKFAVFFFPPDDETVYTLGIGDTLMTATFVLKEAWKSRRTRITRSSCSLEPGMTLTMSTTTSVI